MSSVDGWMDGWMAPQLKKSSKKQQASGGGFFHSNGKAAPHTHGWEDR
jgi:hypothetical protein